MLPRIVSPSIPGPKSRELAQRLRAVESHNVTYISERFPVFWQQARGTNVWDVDGNCFLDLTSGFGVAGLGYNSPSITHAMLDQIDELFHAMGDVHPTRQKVELCELLSELTFETWGKGRAKTLLANSGGEAIEAALKTAYMATGKRGVLAFHDSYHGLGYGPLTVTGSNFFRSPFASQLADIALFADFPDCDDCPGASRGDAAKPKVCRDRFQLHLESLFSKAMAENNSIGAIVVEPILGRGGVIVPPDWFLPLLRELAYKFGALLIVDEIFTGFYRTGKRFACDHASVVPDIICLGKSLTNGYPLAACVGTAEIMDQWPESSGEALHTSTFLGNPLGCRMAIAALKEMEVRPTAREVTDAGESFGLALSRLAGSGPWGRLRGRGLMLGLELVEAESNATSDPGEDSGFCSLYNNAPGTSSPATASRSGDLIESLLSRGVIALTGGPDGNILTITPAFRISDQEIEFSVNALNDWAREG